MTALYIDDIRTPYNGWKVIRSYDEAIKYFNTHPCPDTISFDHDLGGKKTGYDIAKWLIEKDLNDGYIPSHFVYLCHSANPVGRNNILALMSAYMRNKYGYGW